MKITRSYWLGLGSGLILSAMLIQIISLQQGQAVIPQKLSSVSPVEQQVTTQSLAAGGAKQADPPSHTNPANSPQPSQGQAPNLPSSTQIEQNFVIPKGVSSERIADLLVVQSLIKDKESFLAVARQMGVESQFQAGTYTLSPGLTLEELIHRLVKK
jgi:hypothetical protein